MAQKLTEADVVVVGLGAAGGTAVWPLAQSGMRVVGIEAGPRVTEADYPFDEVRNDIRDWMGRFKANLEVPTARPTHEGRDPPARRHRADDERGRRHVDPLDDAELALPPVELQGALRDDQALRQGGADRLDRRPTGRSATTTSSRTTTRSSSGTASPGRPATSRASSTRGATSSRARGRGPTRSRRCAAAAGRSSFHGARRRSD